MKKQLLQLTSLCTLALLCCLSINAFAAPPAAMIKPGVATQIQAQPVKPPDIPLIQAFNTSSAMVVQSDSIYLNWTVTPGSGGSQITKVTITSGNMTLLTRSGQPQSQNVTMPVNWTGDKIFTLTATNAANQTKSISKTVRALALADVISKIKILNMEATPQIFVINQPIDFRLFVQNQNPGLQLKGVNIFVMQANRVVGNLTNINVNPGTQIFSLRDSGYQATAAYYVVDLEYKGRHFTKNFKVKPVTSYTIDPM